MKSVNLGYTSWGANQSIMRPITVMSNDQIKKSIYYIEQLIESKRFRFDLKLLTNRLKELEEQLDFNKK